MILFLAGLGVSVALPGAPVGAQSANPVALSAAGIGRPGGSAKGGDSQEVAGQGGAAGVVDGISERSLSLDSTPRSTPLQEIAALRSPVTENVYWLTPVVANASLPRPWAANVSWWTPVVSLLIPGSGQLLTGKQRGVAYLVLEGYLLIQAISARESGDRDRQAYRQVAADVARAAFGENRPVGKWSYYEALETYLESGAYNLLPGNGFKPETDVSTYNGAQWLLAREMFWRDPEVEPAENSAEYQRALDFYRQWAVRDEYRWSWRDARLQQDVYKQHIANANRHYQRAVNYAGVVAANHLLSMVDAFVTVRVRRLGGALAPAAGSGLGLHSSLGLVNGPDGQALLPTVTLRVPLSIR